jgi:DNA-binding NarL/FixJ family response regulator
MIRVAIAEDHPEMRQVLRLLLRRFEGVELVCEASNGQEAVECVNHHQPDVLVMDISMPELDGLTAAKQIADSPADTRVILISVHEGAIVARAAAAAGAQGFITKDKLVDSLQLVIKTVYQGKQYFPELP